MIEIRHGILMLALLPLPAPAQQIDVLGEIRADIGGEAATYFTLRAEEQATASVERDGGISYLSVMGTGRADGTGAQIILTIGYRDDPGDPLPGSAQVELFPTGMTPPYWLAADGAVVSLDRLETGEASGRAEGSFSARLCRQDEPEDDIHLDDCREIRGSFATDLAIGQ